jgi:hypothetical protein
MTSPDATASAAAQERAIHSRREHWITIETHHFFARILPCWHETCLYETATLPYANFGPDALRIGAIFIRYVKRDGWSCKNFALCLAGRGR